VGILAVLRPRPHRFTPVVARRNEHSIAALRESCPRDEYVAPVCFSPEGDLVGGIVVTGIGVDAVRHLHHRNDHVALAALPLILGFHQIDESFVWWGLQGVVPHDLGRIAMWIYLVIAFAVLPIFVPLVIMLLEPSARRRWRIAPFLAIGTGTSTVLLETMLQNGPNVRLGAYHLAYSIGLQHGIVIIGIYIVATCGSLLASGFHHIVVFGFANLVAVVILARLSADGFASLWCFYAAIACGAILLHMRYAKPHRAKPYAVS
jgi:Family of unknown function (DUF6629)